MINLTALHNKVDIIPYDTSIITNLIYPEFQQRLAEGYPSNSFKEFTLQKGNETVDKDFSYKFEFFSLEQINLEYLKENRFNILWLEFIRSITSNEYIKSLSQATKMELYDKNFMIEFSRYRPGDWLDAHYDKQTNKILSQIFYFNTFWDIQWGGYFNILNPIHLEQTVLALPPLINYSVLVKATRNAWHSVSQVSLNALKPRLNVVLEFYNK